MHTFGSLSFLLLLAACGPKKPVDDLAAEAEHASAAVEAHLDSLRAVEGTYTVGVPTAFTAWYDGDALVFLREMVADDVRSVDRRYVIVDGHLAWYLTRAETIDEGKTHVETTSVAYEANGTVRDSAATSDGEPEQVSPIVLEMAPKHLAQLRAIADEL